MKNRLKPVVCVFMLSSLALGACTDVESLNISQPSAQELNPEAYAHYLSNLREYKNSEHQVVYAWFDNSIKAPASPAQHITNVPDSVDFISMMTPELSDFEKTDIETVHQKGTKVVYTISYDGIKAAYDELKTIADETGAPIEEFDVYLKSEVEKLLTYAPSYDGMIANYIGQNPEFMNSETKVEYQKYQDIFLNAIKEWKDANNDKILVWMGKPQNLITRTILTSCKHIILDTEGMTDVNQIRLSVAKALVENVPTGNLVFAVSTTSSDASNKETGYWGTGDSAIRALGEVAHWLTVNDTQEYTKAGIAIYNVQNDYYATGGSYTYVKEAMYTMNPAPTK